MTSTRTIARSAQPRICWVWSPPAAASTHVIARATSAPIASWPSSIRRPTRVDQTVLNVARLDLCALRQQRAEHAHSEPARREERGDDQRNRESVAWPGHAQRLGEPEHAKATEHRPYPELEPVLWDHRQRFLQRDAEGDHEDARHDRAGDR